MKSTTQARSGSHHIKQTTPALRADWMRWQVWRTTRRAGELLRFPSGPDLGLECLTQFGLARFEIGGVHACKEVHGPLLVP